MYLCFCDKPTILKFLWGISFCFSVKCRTYSVMIHASLKVSEFRPCLSPHNTINQGRLFTWRASEYVRCHETNLNISEDIPLTNRVRGTYRKLRTEFFPRLFMAQTRSARAINRRGKKRGSITYGTDREEEVSEIFIISLLCVRRARERFPFTRNGFKFLKQVKSKTSQFEIVF